MKCKTCKRDLPKGAVYCCWCGKYQLTRATQYTHLPKARQLPSGNWRIYLEREKKSITASTQEDCILQAAQYRQQWEKDEAAGLHIPPPPIQTLESVISDYIASRRPVRSPSTIDGYENILRNRFKAYMALDVNAIDYQQMINDELELVSVSAKTVRNAWGLVRSALVQSKVVFEPPALPRTVNPEKNWLDYSQINLFLEAIRENPYELAALLALHSLRKSEILGLHISDYDSVKKIIHVRGALLATADGYVYSSLNKTDTSSRDIPIIIPRLASLLDNIYNNYYSSQASHRNANELIVNANRDGIYKAINKICREANLPEVGLHGLRHSFASLAYHLGWKKKSTMAIGGWHNSKVLDEIYTHNADLQADIKTMQDFFVPESVPESTNDS